MKNVLLLFIIVGCVSCGSDPFVPKPKAFLRLEYQKPQYEKINTKLLPFIFEKNILADNIQQIKTSKGVKSFGAEIKYPSINGTIFLTYKNIDSSNLKFLIKDAQKITQAHAVKANAIIEQPFANYDNHVYGMLYEVDGNAASQAQFFVTDSTKHFLTGALYFYVKPNYDSILPAANYIKNDIQHIMETLQWKN